jgi:hypothetical protein
MLRASLLALALSLLISGEARAGLIFTQTACGGIGESPCTVVQSRSPAINAAPLTQQSFNEFYAWDLFGQTATFSYTEVGSNADYAFGTVSNSVDPFFHTYYIIGRDGLVCCTIDEPWALLGVNAGGLLIGTDGLYPFISTVEMAAASGFFAPPLPFSVIGRAPYDLNADFFLAIDDANNILAQSRETGEFYELRPVSSPDLLPVPSPASLPLLAAGLLSVLIIGKRNRWVTSRRRSRRAGS